LARARAADRGDALTVGCARRARARTGAAIQQRTVQRAVALVLALAAACAAHDVQRLMTVGGVHALDGTEACKLASVEPSSALQDLAWKNALVVRAQAEGRAELTCGDKRARLRLVKPARLELILVDEHVVVGKRFQVRALPRGGDGKELEVGKWTEIAWRTDGAVTPEKDRSAGEFGACDSCFGIHSFRASTAGEATIEARLGEASGTLRVTVGR